MVMNPSQFDIMLAPNLYGSIIQNIGAGLVGGPGLLSGSTYGLRGAAIFESVFFLFFYFFSTGVNQRNKLSLGCSSCRKRHRRSKYC